MRQRFAGSAPSLAIGVLCGLMLAPAVDAVEWENPVVAPNAGFIARYALAYDSFRNVTILYGGASSGFNCESLTQTWAWNGTDWTLRTPTISPSPGRQNMAAAYDEVRHVMVIFGGCLDDGFGHPTAETWEWNGDNWRRRISIETPPARFGAAMVYDSHRHVMVLFGGRGLSSLTLNDTWEWNGTFWVQRSTPALSPPAREFPAMAYDSIRGVVVLFGGHTTAGELSDTWEWDGVNWVQRTPASQPLPRQGHGMAFDAARGVTVLFGGTTGSLPPAYYRDTWEWGGDNWNPRHRRESVRTSVSHTTPPAHRHFFSEVSTAVISTTRGD